MSIYSDYSHHILHHQSEAELILAAEQRRLARELGAAPVGNGWLRRLVSGGHRSTRPAAAAPQRARHVVRTAH
jgi:hypothetical protein